ncbi:MAG: Ig-like domain-containing domain [Bacteroidota bacterium]
MISFVKTNVYKQLLGRARWAWMPIILGLLTHACAVVTMPEGGPKDEVPPKLTKTYPEHECTGFKGKMIKLVFDKEIEVSDIYNKLVVTPKLQKLEGQPSYTYKTRGNTLKLTLAAPLEEETTYTFNFNNAIRDLTEGNEAEAPTLTFSTGDQIDTMYVTGQVRHHMNHEPAAEVWVGLYKAGETTPNYLESPPDYFTKTDEKGVYRLDHISKGKYYIYASSNRSGELKIDPGVDEYGFLREPIDVTAAPVEAINLSILKADIREFKLQRQQPQDQYFELNFNKPVVEYTLVLARKTKRFKDNPTIYSHLIENEQVIRVYNTFGLLEEDSLEARLTARDVLGTVVEEIITLQFRGGSHKKSRALYKFEPTSGAVIKPAFEGKMRLNKPVKEVLVNQLFFVFNGQNTVRLQEEDLQFNDQRDVITLKKQLDPKLLKPPKKAPKKKKEGEEEAAQEGLVLHLEEGALVTVEKDKNDALRYTYTFRDPKEYSTIKGTITTQAPGFIVQLLDTDYEVIDEIRNERHYQFKEVVPGNYKLRVLVLQKPEASWDFGNILEQREPDPVLLHPEEIEVPPNWEIPGINFSF